MSAYPNFLDGPDLPACRGIPVDTFFPRKGEAATNAKAICTGCPLLTECRTWALDQPAQDLHGVWGGLSHHERMEIKSERVNQRRRTGVIADHHNVIVAMRNRKPRPAPYAEIALAIGYTVEGVRAYLKRQKRNRMAVAA